MGLFRTFAVRIELTEPMLGSVAKNLDVYTDYIKTKAPVVDPDETPPQSQEEVEEKGWTGFYEDADHRPVIMDYQIKGFLKEAGNQLKEQIGIKNLRSHIDNEVFVFPRRIVLADKIDGYLERPLRAMTMQGPRVSLIRSDYIDPPLPIEFEVRILTHSKVDEKVLATVLEYGQLKGLGQWRNGSYGRFDTVSIDPMTT